MNLIVFSHQQDRYLLAPGDDRVRHMRKILRVAPGDTVRVGVVGGHTGVATVESMDEGGIALDAEWTDPPQPSLPVTLLLGHPRPPVLRRLWRDLTSMRIAGVHVFGADLSERSYLNSSVWTQCESAVREGLSQGGHTAAPTVRRHHALRPALDDLPEETLPSVTTHGRKPILAFGALRPGAARLPDLLSRVPGSPHVVLCVGPERGFTASEEDLLVERGFTPVGLGGAIMRTETAAVVLCGAVAAALT